MTHLRKEIHSFLSTTYPILTQTKATDSQPSYRVESGEQEQMILKPKPGKPIWASMAAPMPPKILHLTGSEACYNTKLSSLMLTFVVLLRREHWMLSNSVSFNGEEKQGECALKVEKFGHRECITVEA